MRTRQGPALLTSLLLAASLAACSGSAEDDVEAAARAFLDDWAAGDLADAAAATTDAEAATLPSSPSRAPRTASAGGPSTAKAIRSSNPGPSRPAMVTGSIRTPSGGRGETAADVPLWSLAGAATTIRRPGPTTPRTRAARPGDATPSSLVTRTIGTLTRTAR